MMAKASGGGQAGKRTRRSARSAGPSSAGTSEGLARLEIASEVAEQAQKLAAVTARLHMVEDSLQNGRMCEAAAAACIALHGAREIRDQT